MVLVRMTRSVRFVLLIAVLAAPTSAWAGIGCQFDFRYKNADRHVYGETALECGGWPISHTPPWSNWGTETMFTSRVDGNQFRGWKDLGGSIRQWNSCSGSYPYNQHTEEYFNWNSNTEQMSEDEYEYSRYISDVVEDLMCSEIGIYTVNNWFMEIWDLDQFASDYHFRTAEWDEINVSLSCGGSTGEECTGNSGEVPASDVYAPWTPYIDLLWVDTNLYIETWLGVN